MLKDVARKLAPGFLSGPLGERVVYTLHVFGDAVQEWILQGIQGRMPLMCSPTCLGPIGRDRGIVRGFAESEYSYRRRLLWWWNDWRGAGHAYPLLNNVAGYLLPEQLAVRIVTNSGMYYTRAADGTLSFEQASPNNWDWDGASSDWWRFWLIIYDPTEAVFTKEQTWGNGTWGDGGVWGTDADATVLETIREIVRFWMPAHAEAWWLIVSYGTPAVNFTPSSAETDGDWQYWGALSAGTMVANRDGTARYADGTESIAAVG
jgi:hypothetical protein